MKQFIQKRGIAMMIALMALTMLILIAVPFAASMRVEKRSSFNHMARTRAKLIAEGTYQYAVAELSKSHYTMERYAQQPPLLRTPSFDSAEEYEVNLNLGTADPAHIWSVDVEDEQGKININSATPWVLGNLLGSAIATQRIKPEDTVITVDSTRSFLPENGFLWIEGELVSYRSTTPNSFIGCQRGVSSDSALFRDPQSIREGTLIIDAKAYQICLYRTLKSDFRTIEELKNIAELGTYTFNNETMARLRPFVTVYSNRHSAGWIYPQKILRELPGDDISKPDRVAIADNTFFARGATVKISEGNVSEQAIVMNVKGNFVVLDRHLRHNFSKNAEISVLEPHPVHINTAPPQVLFALFKGLRSGKNSIDSKEAGILTDEILKRREQKKPIFSLENYRDFLNEIREKMVQLGVKNEKGEPMISQSTIRLLLSCAYSINGERRRYAGIRVPQIASAYLNLQTPTVPLVFSNFDTYTINTTGVVNNSAGVPLAEYHLSRIVNVAPPTMLRWSLETQNDFETYMTSLPAFRVVSWPQLVRNFITFPQQNPTSDTGLSLDTIPMFPKAPENTQQKYIGFDNTHEGINAANAQVQLSNAGLQIAPGCLSFWFKTNGSSGKSILFEMLNKEKEDTLTCFIEGKNLILEVSDTTKEKAASQIVAPIPLQSQKWFHVMAAWYSTHWGGLALWLDGKPVGEFRHIFDTTPNQARLSKDVKATDTSIAVTSTTGFPNEGAIQIGNEIIEYENIAGNQFQVRKQFTGFIMSTVNGRGTRGSVAADHPKGSPVSVFGYTVLPQDDIARASSLASDIQQEGFFGLIGSDIDNKETLIPASNALDFPPSGYFTILDQISNNQEIVFYDRRNVNGFSNCKRGQLGSSAKKFVAGSFVFPTSITLRSAALYPAAGNIQVNNEWISYNSKDGNFLILRIAQSDIQDFRNTGQFQPKYRGVKNTNSSTHGFGTLALPVFRVNSSRIGKFDRVTLIDKNNPLNKEEKIVNWANSGFAAFTDDIQNSKGYSPGGGTRILKFPSGELPSQNTPVSFKDGNAVIDEIQVIELNSQIDYVLTQAVQPQDRDLPILISNRIPTDGGMVKIGDEYISYHNIQTDTIPETQRGIFNTPSSAYPQGMRFFPVFFVAATSLSDSLGVREAIIPVNNARDFPLEGYVFCEDEVMGYSIRDNEKLAMPLNQEQQPGLRGAFGTDIKSHSQNALVYVLPTRYWDRAIAQYDGTENAFFEAQKTAIGATWHDITWEEENFAPAHLGIKILARVDGKPDWREKPTNRHGGIFEFTDAKDKDKNKLGIRGDTLELRVYFTYKRGAFARNAWKDRALLRVLHVSYQQNSHVYQTE